MNLSSFWGVLLWVLLIGTPMYTNAQKEVTNKLTKDFFKQRRSEVIKNMPPNSVAVFFANPVRNRSNDVDFHYHQDPDFYYLTGLTEPNSVLLLFANPQPRSDGTTYRELLFCQPRNAQLEMWTGKLLGPEGCKSELGIEDVKPNTDFKLFDFSGFAKVLFLQKINNAGDDNPHDSQDLYSMVQHFRKSADIPADYNPEKYRIYKLIKTTEGAKSHAVTPVIMRQLLMDKDIANDKLITSYFKSESIKEKENIRKKVPDSKWDGFTLDDVLDNLREIKTTEELKILKRAIDISAVAQIEVMKAMDTSYSEREIQGIHEFVYKKYGCEYEGYPSIIGAGANGCVLHYTTNHLPRVKSNLVLMDAGAEYEGYTADVTRTIPANGKYSPEQKAVYELVLKAQNAGIAACKAGNNFKAPNDSAVKVISKGLMELGITTSESQYRTYLPHGTSHYLGLDVHDRGSFGPLRTNSVITVEPGIYIPEGSKCDKKWWGIAVRIEDDILITETEPVILSGRAPRTVEEIEKLMQQKSVLNEFLLPDLD